MTLGCVLIEQREGWLLVPAGGGGTQSESIRAESLRGRSPNEFAEEVRESILRLGAKPRVVIALDSPSCFFAKITGDDIGTTNDRKSLLFEMESSLPFDAEQAVADFTEQDGVIAGVAIDQDRWLPLVEALDDAGVLVEAVAPLSVMAANALIAEGKLASGDVMIWSRDHCTDVMHLGKRHVSDWRHVSSSSPRLPAELNAIRASDIATDRLRWIERPIDGSHDDVINESMDAAATRRAATLLGMRDTAWYDLRRDRLAASDPLRPYRGPLRMLAIAASVFLCIAMVASYYRKTLLDRETSRVQEQQTSVFKETFPGARVPAALLSRIRSEHRKALGSRRLGAGSKNADNQIAPQSALQVLDAFLVGMPKNVRYQFTQVDIQDGDLRADVQIRAHNDAGKIAASLESAGFTMLPPGTQQINPNTVSSQLDGKFDASDSSRGEENKSTGGSS